MIENPISNFNLILCQVIITIVQLNQFIWNVFYLSFRVITTDLPYYFYFYDYYYDYFYDYYCFYCISIFIFITALIIILSTISVYICYLIYPSIDFILLAIVYQTSSFYLTIQFNFYLIYLIYSITYFFITFRSECAIGR